VEDYRTARRHTDLRPTTEEITRLRAIPNVWVRALVYASFPVQCPAAWVQTLRTDLRKAVTVPESLAKHVADLDSDQFRVREKAAAELTPVAVLFPQQFAKAAETAGPEARRRLQQMSQQAETLPATLTLRRLAAWLAESANPQSRDVLDVLAEGKQPNRISTH